MFLLFCSQSNNDIGITQIGNNSAACANYDIDIDSMVIKYNTAVTDTVSEILEKECRRNKPWVTRDVLGLCNKRRDLKKMRYEKDGAKEYRKGNNRVQKGLKIAKEGWIDTQFKETDACLYKKQQ